MTMTRRFLLSIRVIPVTLLDLAKFNQFSSFFCNAVEMFYKRLTSSKSIELEFDIRLKDSKGKETSLFSIRQ